MQCKDTLLLEYDYNAQYTKRKICSNADRYKELSDDDDDDENGQMSAADFQQLLSVPLSVGDHFTFAAERMWLQNDDMNTSEVGSMLTDLFKLNITKLQNGLGRVPFYSRQGLMNEMFTADEIADMNYRANFFEVENKIKPSIVNQSNQNLLNILMAKPKTHSCEDGGFGGKMDNKCDHLNKVVVTRVTNDDDDELAELLKMSEIQSPSSTSKLPAVPVREIPTNNKRTELNTHSDNSKSKSNKTEDIQDWLDDILNED